MLCWVYTIFPVLVLILQILILDFIVSIELEDVFMGQGGRIKLINLTGFKVEKTNEHSYQMAAWQLPNQIEPFGSTTTYVEFAEGVFIDPSDDAGETDYTLVGSDDGSGAEYRFQVRARLNGWYLERQRSITVDVKNMAARTDPATIPPQSALIDVNWNHDGEVEFTIVSAKNLRIRNLSKSKFKDILTKKSCGKYIHMCFLVLIAES
jgi:hypothetical protein